MVRHKLLHFYAKGGFADDLAVAPVMDKYELSVIYNTHGIRVMRLCTVID